MTFLRTASDVLFTSNAANGYENVGLLEIATKEDFLADQR